MPLAPDLAQLKRMSVMRVNAQLSPLEMVLVNVMRKRNFGELAIYFQDGVPYRYESKESNLILDNGEAREVLGKLSQTK